MLNTHRRRPVEPDFAQIGRSAPVESRWNAALAGDAPVGLPVFCQTHPHCRHVASGRCSESVQQLDLDDVVQAVRSGVGTGKTAFRQDGSRTRGQKQGRGAGRKASESLLVDALIPPIPLVPEVTRGKDSVRRQLWLATGASRAQSRSMDSDDDTGQLTGRAAYRDARRWPTRGSGGRSSTCARIRRTAPWG